MNTTVVKFTLKFSVASLLTIFLVSGCAKESSNSGGSGEDPKKDTTRPIVSKKPFDDYMKAKVRLLFDGEFKTEIEFLSWIERRKGQPQKHIELIKLNGKYYYLAGEKGEQNNAQNVRREVSPHLNQLLTNEQQSKLEENRESILIEEDTLDVPYASLAQYEKLRHFYNIYRCRAHAEWEDLRENTYENWGTVFINILGLARIEHSLRQLQVFLEVDRDTQNVFSVGVVTGPGIGSNGGDFTPIPRHIYYSLIKHRKNSQQNFMSDSSLVMSDSEGFGRQCRRRYKEVDYLDYEAGQPPIRPIGSRLLIDQRDDYDKFLAGDLDLSNHWESSSSPVILSGRNPFAPESKRELISKGYDLSLLEEMYPEVYAEVIR